VPPQLAQDRRDRERGERVPEMRFEAIHCLNEPEAGDLLQILQRLAAARVPARERLSEPHVALDEKRARWDPRRHAGATSGPRARGLWIAPRRYSPVVGCVRPRATGI
jgi:hypothetical protein